MYTGPSGPPPVEPEVHPGQNAGVNLAPVLLAKKPAFQRVSASCGAGGDRTLVQTTATWAFYMLSRFFGFRPLPEEWHPSKDLGPVSYLYYGPPHKPVLHDDTSGPGRRSTGLPERHSSAVLLFAQIKPISRGLIKQRDDSLLRRLRLLRHWDNEPHLTLGMLTHITKPLSNPDRPQYFQ